MKRILFVDDESVVLDGIRRMLHAERGHWDVQFVGGAEEALQAFESSGFDVVISDMRMPGTDGAELLARIRKRFPEATRIVLSGYSEPSLAARAASDAHRVLAKPCDGNELRETIERVIALRDLIASPRIRQIVGGVGELPSLSSTYTSLTNAIRDPFVSVEQVTAIVERDVAMAAKVLQLTNSAFFGLPRHISSLSSAISYLGTATIRNLALTSEAFRVFKPDPRIPVPTCYALEDHAVDVAAIVGALPLPQQIRDVSVIAGLLHDIGKLFLASTMPDEYCAVNTLVHAHGLKWIDAEEQVLGTSHAEIGAYLLGLWGIPELSVEAIAHHHHPDRIPHSQFDCTLALFVANLLAHGLETGHGAPANEEYDKQDQEFLEKFALLPRMEEFRALAAATCSQH
jgi:HD-like signal output (HDOD) protein